MNSPLTTAVVGTSMPELRPNAPLTPAIATRIARPPAMLTIVRVLSRHMPLHYYARLEPGGHNHFMIVHRPERHSARSRAADVEDSHLEPILLGPTFALRASVGKDGVARHDDDVIAPFELDIDGG